MRLSHWPICVMALALLSGCGGGGESGYNTTPPDPTLGKSGTSPRKKVVNKPPPKSFDRPKRVIID